jgi:hypothetical protein
MSKRSLLALLERREAEGFATVSCGGSGVDGASSPVKGAGCEVG